MEEEEDEAEEEVLEGEAAAVDFNATKDLPIRLSRLER